MTSLVLFLASMAYVALRAFQQRNVSGLHYGPTIPTSYAMAYCDTYLIYQIAQAGQSIETVLALGTGGAIGSMVSMYLHKRLFK